MAPVRPFSFVAACACVVVGLGLVGCSNDDDTPPGLQRIDGPADVDRDLLLDGSTDETDG